MGIPQPWGELSAQDKRARLLDAADRVFGADGIDAPMPAVAAAAGAGVASVYRQFAGKDELVAALLVQRIDAVAARFADAAREADAGAALRAATFAVIDDTASDGVALAAWERAVDHADVQRARARAARRLRALVDAAHDAGALRADASAADVRVILTAATNVAREDRRGARRLVELALDGLGAAVLGA